MRDPHSPRVSVPTLFTVGEFDEVGPRLVRRLAALVPDARYVELSGAAHVTTWDAPEATVAAVRDFLRGVDATATGRE